MILALRIWFKINLRSPCYYFFSFATSFCFENVLIFYKKIIFYMYIFATREPNTILYSLESNSKEAPKEPWGL